MDLIDKIRNLNYEQLIAIVKVRRNVPLVAFLAANGKARSAAMQRHPKWAEELLKYTNAIIQASVKSKVGDALSIATLISAFESLGLAVITKIDLNLEEYDILVSPTISAFPELVVLEQDWTPVPMEESQRYRPAVQYNLPPVETRLPPTRKTRDFRRKEDLEEKVAEEVIDPADFMESLKPKKPVALSAEDAVAAMLKAMTANTAPEVEIIEVPSPEIPPEIEAEIAEDIPDVRIPPSVLKIGPADGGFRITDQDGNYYGEVFKTAIDAIIYAAGQGLKLT